jgi:hypothetical protein
MISSIQQLQLSSKTEKSTRLSRNICISWSLNVVLAVTTIVLLLVASLDAVQAVFCVHLVAFCITCAVLVWTKDSRNAFVMSLGFPVAHFVLLLCVIWDCEPLFFVLKMIAISCVWSGVLLMRISGSRLVYALEHKPKSRVRVTIVQLLIGASLMLVTSLHLAYPEHEVFLLAEMVLWGCFIVDLLWHFGIWKKTIKRVFRGVTGNRKLSGQNANASLNMIEGIKRRQIIVTVVGTLFTEIIICAGMICANPTFDLLLQDKGNECKQRDLVGSHRLFAFGFATFSAADITLWVMIHSLVLKKRRDQKLNLLSMHAPQQVVVLPHHGPNSGLAKTNEASEREMN